MQDDRVLIALKLIAETNDAIEPPVELADPNLTELIKEAEQQVNRDSCILCGIGNWEPDHSELSQHHIAGKVLSKPNYPDTITVCSPCHDYLTDHQRTWLVHRQDYTTQLSCYFFGWADVFELISNKSGYTYFERLATKFRHQGYYIRNRIEARRWASRRVITA